MAQEIHALSGRLVKDIDQYEHFLEGNKKFLEKAAEVLWDLWNKEFQLYLLEPETEQDK